MKIISNFKNNLKKFFINFINIIIGLDLKYTILNKIIIHKKFITIN